MQRSQFGVGDRVVMTHTINLAPYTVLVPGEKGTVVDLVDDMGIEGIEVRLDTPHSGLRLFDNVALLTMPELSHVAGIRSDTARTLFSALVAAGVGICVIGAAKAHALAVGTGVILGQLSSHL
jgi:hypothetical protein